jgi:surface antigen
MFSFHGRAAVRVLTAFIAASAVITGALVVAPAAFAGTDDYPMKWKKPARDSMFDDWGEYNRECTSWAAWRLHGHNGFTMPFHANANKWGEKARALGYTVDKTPAVGSIAWWDTNTRSHVAWVEAVNPDNTVTIEEYNIGGSGKYDETTISKTSPSGFIHFRDLATSFADGAYIAYHDKVYRMAGGAPLYVSTWKTFGKKPVGLASPAQFARLQAEPADGTFLVTSSSKKIYRVVGGAPVYISSWDVVGGKQPSVTVTEADIIQAGAGAGSPFRHLGFYPDGTTYVTASPSGTTYKIVNGTAAPVLDGTTVDAAQKLITIGDDDIAKAGSASSDPYGHLHGRIVAGAPSISGVAKLNHVLSVNHGVISTRSVKVTYTWLRNGQVVLHVHGSTFKLGTKSLGKAISVRVTITRANYQTVVQTTSRTAAVLK